MRGRRKRELIKKLGEPKFEYLEEEKIRKWLLEKLKRKYGSKVFEKVSRSKEFRHNNKIYCFYISPDADILEIRNSSNEIKVIAYEIKGLNYLNRPPYYAGFDQVLAHMYLSFKIKESPTNKTDNSILAYNTKFRGSIFDYVYLVHPYTGLEFEQEINKDAKSMAEFMGVGYLIINSKRRLKELAKPKINPNVNSEAKKLFLDNIDLFKTYER